MKVFKTLSRVAAGLLVMGVSKIAYADFVTLPVEPRTTTTLTACNPKSSGGSQSSTLNTCKVAGLPGSSGLPGYILRSSRTSPIMVDGVQVGTLYDRVWCLGVGTTCSTSNTYVLGMRVQQTASYGPWTQFNDVFRTIRSAASADIAYFMGGTSGAIADSARSFYYLEYTGRTIQGLAEPFGSGLNKVTNNRWVNFRASSALGWSPWMLVRQVCPSGYNTTAQPEKVRLLSHGGSDVPNLPLLTAGFVCR